MITYAYLSLVRVPHYFTFKRPTARELLKHRFITNSAKRNDILRDVIERAEECRLNRYYEHNGSGLDSDPDDDDERDNVSSWVS